MCGIAGVANRGDAWPEGELLRRMADRMVHRGPDEDGFFVGRGIGLAFRRLRVIDLETGHQPQMNEDGSVRVVFNGEIYNHRELRAGLEARGHRFSSRSDTEVLVHLWEEHGPGMLSHLNGMFALALWDDRQRTLLLARDRIGIKPLVWGPTPEGIAFGSEIRCVLEAREEGARLLRELLEDAVQLRQVADVPLGAFLSGGVDSTAIVGLMTGSEANVRTFSIGFQNDPVFDETRWAREAAEFHGTRHTERQLDVDGILGVLPTVLDSFDDEPFGSSSILPAFMVSRETRRELTVALSGDGADELFAGYEKHLGEAWHARWNRVPWLVRRGILEPLIRALPASRDTRLGELGRKAHRFLDGVSGDPAERHDRWMRFAGADEVNRLLGLDRTENPGLETVRGIHADWEARGGTDPLNRALFTDLRLALPTDMLRKVDSASMLNSLEVRVPFLDHRVVELALAFPGEWKMDGSRRKVILRDAIGDLLPASIRERPKAGFEVPIGEWLKGPLRDLFWDTVSGAGETSLDHDVVRGWYADHCAGRAERAKILWAVFTLRWWERRRDGAASGAGPAAERPRTLETV